MRYFQRFAVVATMSVLLGSNSWAGDSGMWSGSISCSYGAGALSVMIDQNGNVSGSVTNGKIQSGYASGGSISFSTSNFFGNRTSFQGIIRGSSMSGTYTQTANGETCRWQASKTSGASVTYGTDMTGRTPQALNRGKSRKALLSEARTYITAAEASAKVCSYADQMNAAHQYRQAAEVLRAIGDMRNAAAADANAGKIVRKGGTADRCDKSRSASRPTKRGAAATTAAADHTARCKANHDARAHVKRHGGDTREIDRLLKLEGC